MVSRKDRLSKMKKYSKLFELRKGSIYKISMTTAIAGGMFSLGDYLFHTEDSTYSIANMVDSIFENAGYGVMGGLALIGVASPILKYFEDREFGDFMNSLRKSADSPGRYPDISESGPMHEPEVLDNIGKLVEAWAKKISNWEKLPHRLFGSFVIGGALLGVGDMLINDISNYNELVDNPGQSLENIARFTGYGAGVGLAQYMPAKIVSQYKVRNLARNLPV